MAWLRPLVRLRNSGTVPGGSMITKRVTNTSPASFRSAALTAARSRRDPAADLVEECLEHVGRRGVLAEPVGLAVAVVVARARDQQAELPCQAAQPVARLRRVVPVVDLEAREPGGRHRVDRVLADGLAALLGRRVGEHGHAT